MTSGLCTVDDLIDEKLSAANLSNDEEECEEITLPSSKDAIDCIEKLRAYFLCQNTSEKTFHKLNSIYSAVIKTQRQLTHQTTMKDFFKSMSP